jgi:hypothetical protein
MEPTLLVTLGPPPDGWQRECFDEFQEIRAHGDFSGSARWQEYEEGILKKILFTRKEDGPAAMEDLISLVLDAKVRISGHGFGYGCHRGLWVGSLTLRASDVRREDGMPMEWPPESKERGLIGDVLGYFLRREWVYVAALIPVEEKLGGGR